MKTRYALLVMAVAAGGLLASAADAVKKEPMGRDADLRTASGDASLVRQGRETYAALCQACHGEEKAKEALGDAPTNLFDGKWYNGSQPSQIEGTILNGLLEKGMPPWRDALPVEDTTAVAAFLLSFQKNESAPAAPASMSPKNPAVARATNP